MISSTMFPENFRYLLVTHIPFSRQNGQIVTDGLWLRDLEQLIAHAGPVRIAAPDHTGLPLQTWGPSTGVVPSDLPVSFVSLPRMRSPRDFFSAHRIKTILSKEAEWADLVHTSHCFHPYTVLYHAHHTAVRLGKKTLFVIAEDFNDIQTWEWIRPAVKGVTFWRRTWALHSLIRRVKACIQTASLTFLHTPAAVARYRLYAKNAMAIRQPIHSVQDIITGTQFMHKCLNITSGEPLRLISACRHVSIKGLDFAIRAIHQLTQKGISVEAHFFGKGPQTETLQKLIAHYGLQDRVFLPGALPSGTAVYEEIGKSHLFLMLHRTTDFGRGFFDAMTGATPVIAFHTSASAHTVRDQQDGVLVPLDDVESLAAAIQKLHENRSELCRLSEGALLRAKQNTRENWFGWRCEWIGELFVDDARFATSCPISPVQMITKNRD